MFGEDEPDFTGLIAAGEYTSLNDLTVFHEKLLSVEISGEKGFQADLSASGLSQHGLFANQPESSSDEVTRY